ncbi:MAG: GLUG motif-containing protein, partial [Planctomycetota bacterium]
MKVKSICGRAVVFGVACALCSAAFGQPWDGSGVEGDPYKIWTAADMQAIGADSNYWDGHFKLMADIDLSSYDGEGGRLSFNLIGGEFTWNGHRYAGNGFTGVFDGDGRVISNFTYESPGMNCVALFRGVEGGQLRNLGLINPSVQAQDLTGALVAVICQEARVSKCWVEGGSVTGSDSVGGLAAYTEWDVEITDSYTSVAVYGGAEVGGLVGFNNYDGYITRCYATGNVNGYENVGGFVGMSREGVIEQCYATGDVTAIYRDVGGFAGCIADYMEVNNCYARGDVTGYDYVGNFLGGNTSYTSDVIRCYATGYINGRGGSWVHGMAGRYYPDCYILEYNFFDTQTSGTTDGCAAFGKTTAQMYQESTYTAGEWDFETPMWTINEGADYPRLWWETFYFSNSYGGGTGRPGDPFLIYDANQMNAIGGNPNDWDKHFVMVNDVNLSEYTGTEFNIIGNGGNPFTGVFDGNGHDILNFSYTSTGTAYIGIFGHIQGANAKVTNLGIVDPNVDAGTGHYVGLVAGYFSSGTISNCYVKSGIIRGRTQTGVFIGRNAGGNASYCYATTKASGEDWIGGFVGGNFGTISACYATGNVAGGSGIVEVAGVGGFAGYNGGTIVNCYARGSVVSGPSQGGLVGSNHDGSITYCYATGSVSSGGGLTNDNSYGTITQSFWDIETSGQSWSAGGTGKTTAEMKTAATFLTAGWDFNFESANGDEDVWTINEGLDYPRLCSILGMRYGGGTGEPNNPYLIYTAAQMNTIGTNIEDWGKSFKLMSDISMADYDGSSYNIIGTSPPHTGSRSSFRGIFDGNYHSINGFTYSAYNDSYVGLFGYIYDGTIKNLKVVSPNITDPGHNDMKYVGAIAGCADRADISGCSVVGGIVEGEQYIGGIVGLTKGSYIAGCGSSASVSGGNSVGGTIGDSSILSRISDSYARGAVSGADYVGGFIGDSSDAGIVNCYSTGLVSGTTNVGGFSGYNVNQMPLEENVIGCLWDVESSGEPNSVAGTGLTTAQMYDENTFIDSGWDFVAEITNGGSDDWAMPGGGGYPILWYELPVVPALPTFAGGSGTAGDPYLIGSESQLNSIGHNPRLMDRHFRLISNLDLKGLKYYMIADRPYVFSGTFDGADHTISNIVLKSALDMSSIGLVGSLKGNGASIQNLILADANMVSTWGWGVGSLAGINENGTITNCHAVNAHVTGLLGVGGLVGVNYWYGRIAGCSATGDVSEETFTSILGSAVGGLVGENSFWSEIDNCYARCDVYGDDYVGGLVGNNQVYSCLTDCYAGGSVTGTADTIGGLIGKNQFGTEVDYCYSSSVVTGPSGTDSVGGFVGRMRNSGQEYYTACFWDSDVNPDTNGIGNGIDPNVIGESTANMKTESTFVSAGWDFTTPVWLVCEGRDYPRLAWQIDLVVDIDIDDSWMYQNLPGQTGSTLTVSALSIGDPKCNSSYSYAWEIVLPEDVSLAPTTAAGGGAGDASWTLVARGCDEPGGLSDSGQTFTVRVTVTGDDYGNTGVAEAEFGIALLGDVNNDAIINVADRSIANAFWR